MDDLRDSLFMGQRIVSFVGAILNSRNGGNMAMNPLSGFEIKLLESRSKIVELNESLDGALMKILTDSQKFIPPHTVMRMFLYAESKGFLEKASKLVYFASRDGVVLTDEEINELMAELRKDSGINLSILLAIYGISDEKLESKDEEPKYPRGFKPTSLNLPKGMP